MLTGNDWLLFYVLVSLLIWLFLEVSGDMDEARKNIMDGTSKEFLLICLWLPILIICIIGMIFVGISELLNKLNKIRIF